MKYYKNCSDLPIYNFFKISETNNLGYLVIGYDEEKVINDKKLVGLWDNILEEYYKLTNDSNSLLILEVTRELIYLKKRFEIVSLLLEQLSKGIKSKEIRFKYFDALNEWEYYIKKDKPLGSELNRMYKQLKASFNTISIKQAEYDELNKKSETKKTSLIEQIVKLEQALSRNEIDDKKTSVAKYIALINEVKLINQARRKQNGK